MQTPPFNDYLGVEISSASSGVAEATVELKTHHLNLRGVAHGGVVTGLLDSVLGAAVISAIPDDWWCATTSMSTQFADGAGAGRLIGSGRVSRFGRHVAFATGEVRDSDNRIIATAHGTWHLWPQRPDMPRTATKGAVRMHGGAQTIRVGKILAVGRNYAAHKQEMGTAADEPPVEFLKPSTALVPGDGLLRIPTTAGAVHHEVELVVVIGKAGRAIPEKQAMDHVLGYAVGLDLTLRDVQSEAKQRRGPWDVAKGFDGSAPVSEVIPRDEVGDGTGLEITLDVNGERRQSGNTSQMLHGIPELIAHVSRWMTLERGDLFFTGTPSGVGPIVPGDEVVARIEKVGTLTLRVVADDLSDN